MNKIQTATYHLGILLCLTIGLLLTACSDDDATDRRESNRQIRLSAGARQFTADEDEAPADALTRAVTYPSTDWTNYLTLYPGSNPNMLVFIAKNKDNPSTSDVLSRLCSFTSATSDWQANVTITDTESGYQIFGFMPIDLENSSDNVSISPLTKTSSSKSYMVGAQMTIKGLKVLTTADPCVIVGVVRMETNTSDVTLQWGKFDFTFNPNASSDVTDYMSILLDHIYSRFHFSMKIDADYAKLRTIRITKMTVEALNNDGTLPLRSVDATVTIRSNTTNSNPITGITYSRNTGSMSITLFDKTTTSNTSYTNGIVLDKTKTDYQEVGFCLAPCDQRWFRLTTEYEVLDKSGALIRTDAAVNSFNTADFKEKKITSTTPGLEHTIQITVNPTYLYMLSDPDLDNPTITIN